MSGAKLNLVPILLNPQVICCDARAGLGRVLERVDGGGWHPCVTLNVCLNLGARRERAPHRRQHRDRLVLRPRTESSRAGPAGI
jgi:hypothetical protein